ncbi:hypothetical protein [Peterkaempfera sp. SMS 1(5)a]|uniref:hypothetical protein n=1 Tax=Peterkaempfera podocarpi TaxID=3232308 RepID=UPI00366B391D
MDPRDPADVDGVISFDFDEQRRLIDIKGLPAGSQQGTRDPLASARLEEAQRPGQP